MQAVISTNKHLMKEKSAATASRISHYYNAKLANLPPPLPPSPPRLPPPAPMADYHAPNGYHHHDPPFSPGFANGPDHSFGPSAHTYEASGSSFTPSGHNKRPASGALSDASSDFEVPTKPLKKRRTGVDLGSDASPGMSSEFVNSPLPGKGGKGKAKHLPLVDDAKSQRKKSTPKKKLGSGFEMDTPMSSHAPSISDVTPSISRPSSPVSGITPIVYELDEEVPPLRKAKKMDESAMVKRVKALEEAQRKVWTNIARKEVAKVCVLL